MVPTESLANGERAAAFQDPKAPGYWGSLDPTSFRLEEELRELALHWWQKLEILRFRTGPNPCRLSTARPDARIEHSLGLLLARLQASTRKWRCRLAKRLDVPVLCAADFRRVLESRLWGLREFAPTGEALDPIPETTLFFPAGLGQLIDTKGDTGVRRENEPNRLNGTESNSYPIIGPYMGPSFAVQTKLEEQVLILQDVSPQK